MAKAKAVNTKVLQSSVSDFIKLYNLELSDKDAVEDKQRIEKNLVDKINEELGKYEY